MVLASLQGLPAFLLYFCVSVLVVLTYLFIYTRITPHNEFELIRADVPGVALALGLSLIGFALPVASAIAHSSNIADCVIWSIIALIVQVTAYFAAQIPVPDMSKRIGEGQLAPAIWLGLTSLVAGLLSAAAMTY